jgi:hypothetical protein
MAALGPLQVRLSSPPATAEMRLAILSKMFNADITEEEDVLKKDGFVAYFAHWYEDQCNDRTGPIATMTHEDLLNIVCLLKDPNETLTSIKVKVRNLNLYLQNDDQIDSAITLSARLWSISSVGDLKQCLSLGSNLVWQNGTLVDTLRSHHAPLSENPSDRTKIPRIFNAANLERIGGIKIHWTSNLLDHLQMTNDDKTVSIFHQLSFLKLHLQLDRYDITPRVLHESC